MPFLSQKHSKEYFKSFVSHTETSFYEKPFYTLIYLSSHAYFYLNLYIDHTKPPLPNHGTRQAAA